MGPAGEDAEQERRLRGAAHLPPRSAAVRSLLDRPGAARRGVWLIVWVIAGLLGLATGLRIGWALVNKQSLVSTAMILALGSLGMVAALNWQPLTLLIDTVLRWPNIAMGFPGRVDRVRGGQLRDDHDRVLGRPPPPFAKSLSRSTALPGSSRWRVW